MRPATFAAPMMVAVSGIVRVLVVSGVGRALRRAADAPRVEQARAVPVVAVHVEAERAGALDEERPPLREECFEGVEVDDGRVGLDLAEVRIGRGRQGEARGHRVLQVEAHRGARIRRMRQRVAFLDVVRLDSAHRVRHQLEALRGAAQPDAAHLRELRHEPVGVARQQRPGGDLVEARDLADDGKPHRAALVVVEAQLRERNPELRRPAFRVPRHLHVPHRVPAVVAGPVVVVIAIALDADRVHRELVGRSVIEVGIDDDLQPVGGRRLIAPREESDDALGFSVEGANRHIEGRRVVGDARGGEMAGRRALGRFALHELRDLRRELPRPLVQMSIDDDGLGRDDRDSLHRRRADWRPATCARSHRHHESDPGEDRQS